MIEVDLSCVENMLPGLIVRHPTGVVYGNQTAGTACAHPEVEGFFVPLVGQASLDDFTEAIHSTICDIWPEAPDVGGFGKNSIEAKTAEIVAEQLKCHVGFLEFDFDRIVEMKEAWIPVKIGDPSDLDKRYASWGQCGGKDAILTYVNCD